MEVAIIDYNAGNVRSVLFAMERLGVNAILTGDKEKIQAADKVIFPGVGEANTTMKHLRATGLDKVIVNLKQPVLGICIGLQLMCSYSEENNTRCLGIFPNKIVRFQPLKAEQKVPHVGWNNLVSISGGLLSEDFTEEYVYYVHSYYAEISEFTTAVTEYINPFSAELHKKNFYAVQFHPEKSGPVGERVLKAFLSL